MSPNLSSAAVVMLNSPSEHSFLEVVYCICTDNTVLKIIPVYDSVLEEGIPEKIYGALGARVKLCMLGHFSCFCHLLTFF